MDWLGEYDEERERWEGIANYGVSGGLTFIYNLTPINYNVLCRAASVNSLLACVSNRHSNRLLFKAFSACCGDGAQ